MEKNRHRRGKGTGEKLERSQCLGPKPSSVGDICGRTTPLTEGGGKGKNDDIALKLRFQLNSKKQMG